MRDLKKIVHQDDLKIVRKDNRLKTTGISDDLKLVDKENDLKTLENDLKALNTEVFGDKARLKEVNREIDNILSELKSQSEAGETGKEDASAPLAVIPAIQSLNKQSEKAKTSEGLNEKLSVLLDERDYLESKIANGNTKTGELEAKIFKLKNKAKRFSVNRLVGSGIKSAANTVKTTGVNAVKNAMTKADPFAKGINKEDVSDTGAEGIRLAHQTVSKTARGIRTVKSTLKTSARTLKTAKRVTTETVRAAYNTAATTVRTAYAAAKMAVTGATHIIAALTNPVVLVAVAALIVVSMSSQLVVILMGGAIGGSSMTAGYGAVGLTDVEAEYQNGANFLNIAMANKRDGFYALVNAPVYLGDDKINGELANSDLVFLRVAKSDGGITNYSTAFATDWQKMYLRNAWDLTLPTNEILAIAYVLLQKNANTLKGTTGQVYTVTYTQEIINQVVDLAVNYYVSIYSNQSCPGQDCTIEITIEPNPAYVALEISIDIRQQSIANVEAQLNGALEKIIELEEEIEEIEETLDGLADDDPQYNVLVTQLNTRYILLNSQIIVYNTYVGILNNYYENLNTLQAQLAATPPTIEVYSDPFCDWLHDLHSINLHFFTTEHIMNSLGFTASDKNWVRYTIQGFEDNPNL